MAVSIAVQDVDATRRHIKRRTIISFTTMNYVAPGGLALDLTKATNPNYKPYGLFSSNPSWAEVTNQPVGFVAKVVKGTAPATGWTIRLFSTGGGSGQELVEFGNGTALPADLLADTDFEVTFSTLKGK